MKRGIPLLLLLAIPFVTAAIYTESFFDESIISSGVYTASNGENFTIELLGNTISLEYPGGSALVDNASCKSTSHYEICLSITKFSHYDYEGAERIVNFRDITISAFVAKINLTRTFEKADFWIGESAEVAVRMQNIGDRPATVSFLDNFSGAFDVAPSLKCDVKDNVVKWKGRLGENEVFECVYKVTAAEAGSFSSTATAAYNSGLAEESESETAELETRDYPLQAAINLSNATVKLGDEVTAHFNLTATEKIGISRYRILLEGLSIVSADGIDRLNGSTADYADDVAESKPGFFSLTLKAEKTGSASITEDSEFSIVLNGSRVKQVISRDTIVNVTLEKPTIRALKSKFDGSEDAINFIVANPAATDFNNVKVSLSTGLPLGSKEAELGSVNSRSHKEFTAPVTNLQPGNRTITALITYMTPFGETLTASFSFNITVAGSAADSEERQESSEEGAPADSPQQRQQAAATTTRIPKKGLPTEAVIFATAFVLIIAAVIAIISKKKKGQGRDPMSQMQESYRSGLFER